MAVVADNMFTILIGIVVDLAVSTQAGYHHSHALSPFGHSHGRVYAPNPSAPYGSSQGPLYPGASLSSRIATGQSAQYPNIPLTVGKSISYAPSASYETNHGAHYAAPITSSQYASSKSVPLPVSQNVPYPASQNTISSSLSAPLSGTQTVQYSSSQSAPLPVVQNEPFTSSQSASLSNSLSTPLPSSQSIYYTSSQSAPLPNSLGAQYTRSQNGFYPLSSLVPAAGNQNINYASSQTSLPTYGQNAFTPGHSSQTAGQSIPDTYSQTTYAASQGTPLTTSLISNAGSQSSSAGSYTANVNTPSGQSYAASGSPYTTSQVYNVKSSQSASQNSNQSPETSQNAQSISYSIPQSEYDLSKQYNNEQHHYQTGSAPVVTQLGDNYQIVGQSNSRSQHFITTQTVTHQSGGINLDQSYAPAYVNQVAPVVTKHIYFHAPPPEIEERPVQLFPSVPPKKVYNIVFIKVPSQESRRGVNAQAIAASQQANIEDKTLIYVLVKRPEIQPQPQPLPVTSEHEVFYVKYKGDANEVANQINGKLSQQTSLQSDVQSVIEPILQATRTDGSL